MADAAAALASLHQPDKAIFHNDLRAANFLLCSRRTSRGGALAWQVKLAGFGLAVVANAAAHVMVTSIIQPLYRAPELCTTHAGAAGQVAVSKATDICAFGKLRGVLFHKRERERERDDAGHKSAPFSPLIEERTVRGSKEPSRPHHATGA